jgi:hypothetical protein
MNTNNIAKAVQATKIEEKKFEYNKLKNQYESLPERIKNAEMDYYKEGGCNLNDPSDTKRCGLEYYLEIKEDERRKALESFKNKEKENDLKAEEFINFSFFDSFKLNNLFNKTVEGMTIQGSGDNMTCNWDLSKNEFENCTIKKKIIDSNTYVSPCMYNKELEILINENSNKRDTLIKKILDSAKSYIGRGIDESDRKGKVDYRHATFYDKSTDSYKNTIQILNVLYWIVFSVLVFLFIYKKIYEVDSYGYMVILIFAIVPTLLLKPITNLVMLNVKRYHFIDTLYFTIALMTVLLAGFLYFITSKNIQ